ncbi:MAG: hypothetical protein GKR89_16700 [Candidatus Latescibacteria bacterium]|nr:hypothetical protein [Candidatus Latescibacterota bacterium]
MPFDATKSPIQRDEKQLSHLIAAIEEPLHRAISVAGIAEIRKRLVGQVDNKVSCGFIDVAYAAFMRKPVALYS